MLGMALVLPYLLYEIGLICITFAAVYGMHKDLRTHSPLRGWVVLVGMTFCFKAWWLGRGIYRTLGARSVLTIEGDTLSICCGAGLCAMNRGTYVASNIRDLLFESRETIFPTGRVTASVDTVPLVLADSINERSALELIDALCDAYPFGTTAPALSPAVIRW